MKHLIEDLESDRFDEAAYGGDKKGLIEVLKDIYSLSVDTRLESSPLVFKRGHASER